MDKAFRDDLRRHRQSGMAYYALMDFDQSLILPTDTDLRACRRPSAEALYGNAVYKPWDVSRGEPSYNPFAFDVCMLGNLFCMHLSVSQLLRRLPHLTGSYLHIQDVVPVVPACAALFDKMTTHVVSQRFTAEEALRFLGDVTATLDQAELQTPVKLEVSEDFGCYWDKLSSEQRNKWEHLRTPKESWTGYMLDFMTRYQVTYEILSFIRRVFDV